MNVFVTGATGFVGSHLCEKLKKTNKVVALFRDIHPSPWGDWLKEALSDCVLVRGDLLDDKLIRRVIADYDIQEVYHMAAQAIVKTAVKDPFGTFQTNIMGTVNVLEACRQGVDKIYVQSTDKVYGNRMEAQETDPLVSNGIYETSKACADLTAQSYANTYGMRIIIGRPCNTYGPADMNPRIIPNVIRQCLSGKKPIIYRFKKEPVREYLYIDDLMEAIQLLMSKSEGGVYNIGSGQTNTQGEVIQLVASHFHIQLEYKQPPNYTEKEIKSQSLGSEKILRETGWKAKTSFDEGILKTIEWWKQFGFNIKPDSPQAYF